MKIKYPDWNSEDAYQEALKANTESPNVRFIITAKKR